MPFKASRLKSVVIAAAVVAGLSPAGAAMALPNYEVDTSYFSDATHSEEVGTSILTCNGNYTLHGQQTAYSEVVYYEC